MRGKGSFTKRIVGSRTLRTALSVFFILNTILLSCFVMSFSYLRSNSFYTKNGTDLQDTVADQLLAESGQDALLYLQYYLRDDSLGKFQDVLDAYEEKFSESQCNYSFSFTFKNNDQIILRNYVIPKGEIDRGKQQTMDDLKLYGAKSIQYHQQDIGFEGRLKDMQSAHELAHDKFWRASRFFLLANEFKYAVFALMILFAVLEIVLACVVYSVTGKTASMRQRDLDQIPMYFLMPFCTMLCALCFYFLYQQTVVLSDLVKVFSGADIVSAVYTFFLLLFVFAMLLQMLVSTIGVRMHRPMWWRRSILYRTFAARSFGQRVRTVLSIVAILQFTLYLVIFQAYGNIPWWIYLLADAVFVVTMIVLLYIVYKDMSVYIPQTHRIVTEQIGSVSTENLSDSGRKHAENINYLSRNANTETEKRFINESFSTELIHSVSDGLRDPLKEVSENIRLLESGTLTEEQSRQSIAHIVSLSQDLKKTIEDMILISKASTGNLPTDPVPTDAGMMLSQAIGEFYPRFEEAGVEPVTEQPDEPVMICADGQYMWYVFEGVLSVMLENAVPGTRLFMRAGREGENAVIVFRCTVRADAPQQLHELSGMGLSSAKVFTILQGGSMVDHLSHDTLLAVLQFPAIPPEKSE